MIVIAPKTSEAGKTARTAPAEPVQAREPAPEIKAEGKPAGKQEAPQKAAVSRKTEAKKAQARRKTT